jgi:Permuted papain-like amidase enzyme, YaeF/YiiX, C92 family
MAAPLTPRQLTEIPVIQYDKIRSFLKTGDIVFCSGGYLFSKIIQRLTKSTWSHVAVVYKDEELGRVLLLEAEPFVGIRLIPLSKYLGDYKGKKRPYKGKIFISKVNTPIERDKLNRGISFGLDELTRPYDNWEIFRIMLRILFKAGKRERNRSYICSELVRDVYAKAGMLMHLKDSYISPDNIWSDERVDLKYRVL